MKFKALKHKTLPDTWGELHDDRSVTQLKYRPYLIHEDSCADTFRINGYDLSDYDLITITMFEKDVKSGLDNHFNMPTSLVKKGEDIVLLRGHPPLVDCRVVAEDNLQSLLKYVKQLEHQLAEVSHSHNEFIEQIENFYYESAEDWHLWDDDEKGPYPIERVLDAIKKLNEYAQAKKSK